METEIEYIDENGDKCKDLLYSKNILNEFHNLITNSKYSVYALSGGWGTGKTTFIKMWETILKEKKMNFIYIDAFRMDYLTEPVLMLLSAFKDIINVEKSTKDEILDKFKKIFTMRNLTKLGYNVLIDKVGGNALKDFIDDTLDNCFDTLTEETSLYDELSSSLEKIVSQSNNLPVHIIIDELDRCRPDFALETLERIKHIFNIKNVKFILVYNEEVLKSMIKTKYGIEVDTERYLNKFVQKLYVLDNIHRLKNWYIKEIDNNIAPYLSDEISNFLRNSWLSLLLIKEKYRLSLRDMQLLIGNLKQIKLYSSGIITLSTVISLEILRFVDKNEYNLIQSYFNQNPNDENISSILSDNKLLDIFNCFRRYAPELPETPGEKVYNIMKYFQQQKSK